MKSVLLVVAALAAGALVFAGCAGNHKTEKFNINAASVNGASGFTTGTITATEGDKVDIRIGNTTDKAHGFSIDAFGIHKVVQPGKFETVSFTPHKTGDFKIYCQLHPAHVPAQLIVLG